VDQPLFFHQQRLADDRFLQHTRTRTDNTLFGQVVEQFAKDIDGFAANPSRLLGMKEQPLAIGRCTEAILEQCQNRLALFEDGSFIERPQFEPLYGGELAFTDVGHIVRHFVKGEGEKELFGFEIAQLEDEIDLHMEAPERDKQVVFRLGKRKIVHAIIIAKAGGVHRALQFPTFLRG
jgi:hypothetical protein